MNSESLAPEDASPLLPAPVRRAARLIAALLGLLLGLRAAFYVAFHASGSEHSVSELLGALWVGVKFDLRLVLILSLPLLLLSLLPPLDPARGARTRRAWVALYTLIALALALIYVADFAHYDYLHERLNVGVLDHAVESGIATQMVLETYPVGWAVVGLLLFGAVWAAGLAHWVFGGTTVRGCPPRRRARASWAGLALFVGLGIYGKLSFYPLRWSDAFAFTDPFATALALNPVLFFVDSLPDRGQPYDEQAVRASYPLLAELLHVDHPDAERLDFWRHVDPGEGLPGQPNFILIHLESWSGFQTGVLGAEMNPPNDLDPSPFFDELAREGILFSNFFIPRPPTARSVFTMVSGLPDVNEVRSASRNPQVVTQHSLLAYLEDYEKFYFLGGSATWANIRGLLAHNIPGLRIYEEGDYSAPRGDVWGVSDFAMFEEAVGVLDAVEGPVFAFLQTSGNHRPYTIPEDPHGFELAQASPEELLAGGFPSLEAYNGFRFMDHSLKHFFEVARESELWGNTVFMMYGDHGVPAPHGIEWERLQLPTAHVPFLIYAPGLIDEPARHDFVSSSTDILPTALGLLGIPYDNQALGRDLLVERPASEHFAYLWGGLLEDELCLRVAPDGAERLFTYRPGYEVRDVTEARPEDLARLSERRAALHAYCQYMLYHNHSPGPDE